MELDIFETDNAQHFFSGRKTGTCEDGSRCTTIQIDKRCRLDKVLRDSKIDLVLLIVQMLATGWSPFVPWPVVEITRRRDSYRLIRGVDRRARVGESSVKVVSVEHRSIPLAPLVKSTFSLRCMASLAAHLPARDVLPTYGITR